VHRQLDIYTIKATHSVDSFLYTIFSVLAFRIGGDVVVEKEPSTSRGRNCHCARRS
jgi:hypothetical protein